MVQLGNKTLVQRYTGTIIYVLVVWCCGRVMNWYNNILVQLCISAWYNDILYEVHIVRLG